MAGCPLPEQTKGSLVSDDLGLFSDESSDQPRRRGGRRRAREDQARFRRHKRRRNVTALAGLLVLLLVGGGVLFGASQILQIGYYPDYEGAGNGDAVVEVKSGETISDIGRSLVGQDVVASTKAFTKAAENRKEVAALQPGFYLMKHRMSGQAAVTRIVSAQAKVGRLEVRGGMRLEDQASPNGQPTPGILHRLADASCAEMSGKQKCVTPDEIHKVAAEADLASLGAPQWAIGPASAAEPKRRLEGLIMPGLYDVKPGMPAKELLRTVVSSSAAQLDAVGLPQIAQRTGMAPYDVLKISSLTQAEGVQPDFPKISRVIYNRLKINRPLQFDSTINYPLDKPTLLTKDEDRHRVGPYNTYVVPGLPPTPISSASKEAVSAAEKPIEGRWIFFVKCYPSGISCFSETDEQHRAAIREAQARGAF